MDISIVACGWAEAADTFVKGEANVGYTSRLVNDNIMI